MLFAGNITLGICACECPGKGFLVFPGLCCIEDFTLVKSFLGVFSSPVNRLCFCGFSVLSVLTISTQLLIQNYLVQHAGSLSMCGCKVGLLRQILLPLCTLIALCLHVH